MEIARISQEQGSFSLYNSLVLGHNKYNFVKRVYYSPFPGKKFHAIHHLDLVMIRQQGTNNGGFVVSPDAVWYARVLLLFTASAPTNTGSKSFDCALVSTLESYNDRENDTGCRLGRENDTGCRLGWTEDVIRHYGL